MNILGVFAIILGIIGTAVTITGIYFIYQDQNSTSTRSVFWTVSGAIVLFLSIILMILGAVFKGKKQKEEKMKVDKRVRAVKKKISEEIDNVNNAVQQEVDAQEQMQQMMTQQQYEEEMKRKGSHDDYDDGDYDDYDDERYEKKHKHRKEIVYVPNPNFTRGATKELAPVEKEMKELKENVKTLSASLESKSARAAETLAIERDVERRERDAEKMRAEHQKELQTLMGELKTIKERDAKKDAKKKQKQLVREEIQRTLAPYAGSFNYGGKKKDKKKFKEIEKAGLLEQGLGFMNQLAQPKNVKAQQQMMENVLEQARIAGEVAGKIAGKKSAEKETEKTLKKEIERTSMPLSDVPHRQTYGNIQGKMQKNEPIFESPSPYQPYPPYNTPNTPDSVESIHYSHGHKMTSADLEGIGGTNAEKKRIVGQYEKYEDDVPRSFLNEYHDPRTDPRYLDTSSEATSEPYFTPKSSFTSTSGSSNYFTPNEGYVARMSPVRNMSLANFVQGSPRASSNQNLMGEQKTVKPLYSPALHVAEGMGKLTNQNE